MCNNWSDTRVHIHLTTTNRNRIKYFSNHANYYLCSIHTVSFTVHEIQKVQNLYSKKASINIIIRLFTENVAANRVLRTRSTFCKWMIVLVVISACWRIDLIFIEFSVKVKGKSCYHDNLLNQHLLPSICASGRELFTFQQNDVRAHWSRETLQCLFANLIFISSLMWPSNSSDLNLLDYELCNILHVDVYPPKCLL